MNFENIGTYSNFGTIDWCIVAVYLTIILGIAVFVRKYIANIADFVVAGRSVKPFLAVASMIGSELGLVTVMYASQKGFTSGFAAFHIALVCGVVTLIVGLTGFIVVPLRSWKIMTIPEFYEKRFGRGVRILGGAILAFAGILVMGMFLKAGSIFVMGITGLTSDLHLKIIMTVCLGLILLCTCLGGMVSIVILDYIQFIILSIGLLAMVFLSIKTMGWNCIVESVKEVKGVAGFDPFCGEGFGISYVIWMFFMGLIMCAVWQTAVIRACSTENVRAVKKLYVWSSIGFLIRFLLPYFLGISAFAYVVNDPSLKSIFLPETGLKNAQDTLMAMPLFMGRILPAGLIGIVLAGMAAALMSTHNSYILCWSAVLTQDVVAPWFKSGLSSKTRIRLTRIFIIAIAIYLLVWGLWYPLGQDLWDYMAIGGAIYGSGAAVLLVFGIYWKRASKVGAYSALICGFCCILGLKPIQNLLGINISTEVVGLLSVGASIVSMIILSLVFPQQGHVLEPEKDSKE